MKWKKIILLICIYIILTASIAICLSILQNYYLIRSGGVIAQPPEYSFEGPASYIISKNVTYILAINSKGQVEFIGTNATAVIQSAVDAVGTKGGGKIFIKNGEYYLSGYINLKSYSYINIEGESWNTIFKLNNGNFNAFYFQGQSKELGDANEKPNVGCRIADLQIDGGANVQFPQTYWNQQNGIQTRATRDSTFERLYIHDMGRTGIYNTEFSHRNLIFNNLLFHNWRYGLSYTSSSRGRVIGNHIKENHDFGMNWDSTFGANDYTIIANNRFENNTTLELYVIGDPSIYATQGTITGNTFNSPKMQSDWKVITLSYADHITITGNTFYARKAPASSGTSVINRQFPVNYIVVSDNIIDSDTYSSIALGDVNNCVISNNQIRQQGGTPIEVSGSYVNIDGNNIENTVGKAIAIGANSYFSIQNNVLKTTETAIQGTMSPTTKVKGNIGFVTENSGTATISTGTSVTFNHGLQGTPTMVTASFDNTAYGSYAWSATSTQITITVATSGTYRVTWYAEYKP